MPIMKRIISINTNKNNITDVKFTVKISDKNGITRNTFRLICPKFAVRIPVSIPS